MSKKSNYPKNVLLNLADKSLTNRDVHDVIKELSKNSSINQLDLSNNFIGDIGIKAIVKSPFINKVFYFNLYNNLIGDEGATAIVASSKFNNIASLNLSKNCITTNGVKAIAKHLSGSKLVNLDLIFNPGSEDPSAFYVLLEAIKQHRILQYLHVPTEFNRTLRPVLLNNRKYVTMTKQELVMVIAVLKDYKQLSYPSQILSTEILCKFQVFYFNQMLNSQVIGQDQMICTRLQNYINDHFFKITKVVNNSLEFDDCNSKSIAHLPPEVLHRITKCCVITDIKEVSNG